MRMHVIAHAVVLACVSSGVALAAPVARSGCPGCISPAGADATGADRWIAMGDSLSAAERYREAVAAYERSIQLDVRVASTSTRRVARAYALLGNDKQAVRWLALSLRAGVAAEELLADPVFERYRGDQRLRVTVEQKIDLRLPAGRVRPGTSA